MPFDVARIMREPRLKVERADRHIDALISLSAPLSKELYEITLGPARSVAVLAQPDCFDLSFRPKKPIPEFFALVIGDAAHNLRASLDYWAASLLRVAKGTARDTRCYFPFYGKGQSCESHRGYKTIEKAVPAAAKFIRDHIKPGFDHNFRLWSVTELDNIDKHNFILPTVTVASVSKINARIGTTTFEDCTVGGNANGPINMFRIGLGIPITIGDQFETSVEITFAEGGLFENEPVIPTLRNLSEIVTQTLDALEDFLRT